MVLGMRSSEVGCTDFRLILDLKRVLIKVDFPKPLCPGDRTGLFGVALQRGQATGLRCSDAWASPPSTPWLGVGQGEVRRQEGAWVVAELSQCVVAEQDTDPSPSDHKLPHARSWGAREELRCRTVLGRQSAGLAPPVQIHS